MSFFSHLNIRKTALVSTLVLLSNSPISAQTDFSNLITGAKSDDSSIELRFDLNDQSTVIEFVSSDGQLLTVFKDYSDELNTAKTYIADGYDTLLEVNRSEEAIRISSETALSQRSNGDVTLEYSEKQSILLEGFMDGIANFGQTFNNNRSEIINNINLALNDGVATRITSECSIAIQNNVIANITEEIACFPNPTVAQCGLAIGASTTAFQAMLLACGFFEDDDNGGSGNNGGSSNGSNGGGGSSGGNPTIIIIQGSGSGSAPGGGHGGDCVFSCGNSETCELTCYVN